MDELFGMTADHRCFCDLAPLYALDLLEGVERQWVEQQIADSPDLAAEIAELQTAAAAIAYGAPAAAIAPNLKDRLFAQLALDPPPPPPAPPLEQAIRAKDLDWQPGAAPGVTIAILYRDEIRREIVGLLRAEPGVCYPLHRHAAMEEIYMLEGDLISENAVYGPGDYVRSIPGSTHGPHTVNGCQFFFRTSIDDDLLESPLA